MVASGKLISGIKIIVILILSAVTIIMSSMIDRYEVSGGELLANNNFDKKFEDWHKAGDGITVVNDVQPVVQLKSENTQKIVSVRQTLENIQKGQTVRLAGTMKTHDVGRGDKVWKAARIIFVAMDDDGRSMYNVPHILVMRNGTTDWEHFSKVFVAVSHAARYYVEIQLVNVTGTMWVKDISLRPVEETLSFRLFQSIGVLLWVVVIIWILAPYRRTIFSSNWNLLIIAMVMVALFGALAPVDLKHSVVESTKIILPWVDDDEADLFRIGHFIVYSMLSVVVFWKAQSGRLEFSRFGLLVLLAMATEIMQFMVPGRTPRISDFFVDLSGIVMGLFISRIFSSYNKTYFKHGDG